MTEIAEVYIFRNGSKKITISLKNIYKILRDVLGYRYTKINNKGYYLKEENGFFVIIPFYHLNDDFIKYVNENFNNMNISKSILKEEFFQVYYHKMPIKNGNYAREFLSENFQISDFTKEYLLNNKTIE